MRHFRSIGVISITIALLCAGGIDAHADMSEVCDNLEEAGDDQVTLSVKYQSVEARDAVWSVMNPVMHLDFISRVIGDVSADDALAFCRRIDVAHMELIASKTKDVTLHRLLEIYRVYTYVLGGRFSVAAFNFSQGVRNQSLGKGESGERTISEALDVVANRIAPVFVAAGNSPEIGLSPYAGGGAVLPVVATEAGGSAIFARSSRPSVADGPNRLFLFADGAPRPQASSVDGIDHPACNTEIAVSGAMEIGTAPVPGTKVGAKIDGKATVSYKYNPVFQSFGATFDQANAIWSFDKVAGEVKAGPIDLRLLVAVRKEGRVAADKLVFLTARIKANFSGGCFSGEVQNWCGHLKPRIRFSDQRAQ